MMLAKATKVRFVTWHNMCERLYLRAKCQRALSGGQHGRHFQQKRSVSHQLFFSINYKYCILNSSLTFKKHKFFNINVPMYEDYGVKNCKYYRPVLVFVNALRNGSSKMYGLTLPIYAQRSSQHSLSISLTLLFTFKLIKFLSSVVQSQVHTQK